MRSWPLALATLEISVLSTAVGTAQDALRTALRADQSARARQIKYIEVPDRLRAGPVEFTVGLSYSGEFNDNLRTSPDNRESDYVHRPEVNLGAILPLTTTARLSLGVGIGYAKYSRNEDLDRLYLTPDTELAYDFSVSDFRFTFYEQVEYSQDVGNVGALAGVAEFPRFENTIGSRVTWAPSEWSYQAGYSHYNFLSIGDQFGYLDRASEQLYFRTAYSFAPATQVGIESTVAFSDYTSEAQADNTSTSIGPYTEWQVTEAVSLSMRGGFTKYFFDAVPAVPNVSAASPSYSLSSYYAGIGADHKLTQFISHGVSLSRGVNPGVNSGRDYIESFDASYQIGWQLTDRLSVSTSFGYNHGKESGVDAGQVASEIFDVLRAGLSGSYRVTSRASLNARYGYTRRTSDDGDRNYVQNLISMGLSYRFY